MIFKDVAIFDYGFEKAKVFLNVDADSISLTKEELQEMIDEIENRECE